MSKENTEIIASSDKEKAEIQQILDEIPDEVLIGVIADRIRRDPDKEVRNVLETVSQHSFSGPIPPPSMLAQYDSVHGGLADRIVAMAEAQQKHRQSLEKKSVDAAIKTETRGQNYALIVSLLIIAGGTLTGLAYIFITGRKKETGSDTTDEPP
jgi:uncharacterized membrane protein